MTQVAPPEEAKREAGSRTARLADFLGLERNVIAVGAAIFLMGLGEGLWNKFAPKYLEALGAPVLAIGLYGSASDFLDGIYQYPGGWIADRFGRRTALRLFIALAVVGYATYLIAPSWPVIFLGLAFVLAWSSMASPTLFAVVGDALPKGRRAMGFTVQAILRRVPKAIAPLIGGFAIARYGIRAGVHIGLELSIALAILTMLVVARIRIPVLSAHEATNIHGVWRSLPGPLRRLLISDVFVRTCEGLVDVFLVLFATNIVGVSVTAFGTLIAVQMITSILVYIPAARIADRIGRKPFVIATFVAFALFPVAVVVSRSFAALVLAFVIGGLREIGEPARKALIVDLATPHLRARSVGLYYLVRSLCVAPAAFVGGMLWELSPSIPFIVAGIMGTIGTLLFALTVSREHAG
jgi:MFS family permease